MLYAKAILVELYRKKLPSHDYDDVISTGVVECLLLKVLLPDSNTVFRKGSACDTHNRNTLDENSNNNVVTHIVI